jgi:acyl-[acyl-carrier-protein] desaturase
VALERFRMKHMGEGYQSAHSADLVRSLAYVSFQELATRVSHRNTGKATQDPIGEKLLARIATDENLHMIFYRNLVTAAFDINPDEMMKAVANEVINFEMPGANMANFRKNSIIIAKAGIYDPRLHFDEVVSPILRTWKVFERTDFGPEGEKAREELAQFLAGLDEQATKFVDNRERMRARIAAKGQVPVQV